MNIKRRKNLENNDKKKVLLIANNYTALNGMCYLAERLQKQFNMECIIFCENCYCESRKFKIINVEKESFIPKSGLDINSTFYGKKAKRLSVQLNLFIKHYVELGIKRKHAKKILKEVVPHAIIFYCDRMLGYEQVFLGIAKDIPTIVVPIAISSSTGQLGQRYYNLSLEVLDNKKDINSLAYKINPNWASTENGNTRLFYSAGIALAGLKRNMISRNPWVNGAGNSKYVFTVTQQEKEQIVSMCPNKQIIVTGLLEDYEIISTSNCSERIRKELEEKYSLHEQKIVILAMPQLVEHNLTDKDTFENNIVKVIKLLNNYYGKILVSLHPKSRQEDYMFLKEICQINFLTEALRNVMAGSDILVTLDTSSTKRWAHILKKDLLELNTQTLCKPISESYLLELEENVTNDNYVVKNEDIYMVKDIPSEINNILESLL